MVKLRLKRMGAKKAPSYRVVACDSRIRRDGRELEVIGYYDPTKNPVLLSIDEEKALKWLNDGAAPTDTVRNLFSKQGIMAKYVAAKKEK